MVDANQPIVIDNGTGVIKAGFAGSDKPKVVFRSCIGRTKHLRMFQGGELDGSDYFIGESAEKHRGALKLSYPLENGIVENWSDMEKIWSYIYSREGGLNCMSEEHSVLLTEAPLNPTSNREKAAELFFEGLNVPAFYCSIQAVLSLYASGRTTGVVLDSGDGVTHVVPVYEGFALPHAITRMDIAGRHVTRNLQLLLQRSGYNFITSAEQEVVRQIKESTCVVAFNPAEQENQIQNKFPYTLPDGNVIEMGSEAYRAPEILFQPDLIGSECLGVPDVLVKSVTKADLDLRKVLFSQIVLAGGSTMFQGFGDRLLNEVRKHPLSPKNTKVRIAAPPERLFTTWIGGSILASLTTFKNMWITKAEYLEHGSRLFTKQL